MGIPSYYRNIIQAYPEIIIPCEEFKNSPDNLFLDLNCAIHPCCAGKTDELEMYDAIFEKIQECIQITNVRELVYLAIDGPAPRTKMEQQRQRRLKSSQEKKHWDTNQITPGTPFMNELSKYLHKRCRELKIQWIISDSNEPGEGEHKIMHYIDTLSEKTINIVYGLDADLLMLSMIRKHRVFLLRERTEYNIENLETPYVFCDIQCLKKSLLTTLRKDTIHISNETLLNDYLFLCFLIGNDFIINTPSINIRYHGLEHLLEVYHTLQGEYFGRFFLIDETMKINLHYFKVYVKKLSLKEKGKINEILMIRKNQQKKYQRIYQKTIHQYKPRKVEEVTLEKMEGIDEDKFKEFQNHAPVILRDHENEIFKSKRNYYMYHFHGTFDYNPSYDMILESDKKKLCEEYLRSLVWTTQYYFAKCQNWRWYYPYHFTPLLSDLSDYLEKVENLDMIEKDVIPHTPEEQLKIVLPCQNDSYMYPLKTPLHSVMKRYYWECHPVMPH
jgi:5'-3' exonuclease